MPRGRLADLPWFRSIGTLVASFDIVAPLYLHPGEPFGGLKPLPSGTYLLLGGRPGAGGLTMADHRFASPGSRPSNAELHHVRSGATDVEGWFLVRTDATKLLPFEAKEEIVLRAPRRPRRAVWT